VPGLPAESPELPANLRDFSYTLEESEVGFNNFVVIECVIENMDWYFAHHQGNRRANFTYDMQALVYSSWLNS
jgi:3-hydroxyisobutyrate dehydrogenase